MLDHGAMSDDPSQTHPLYATDREVVDSLLGHQGEPGPDQLSHAARLLMRYDGFPGSPDIQTDLERAIKGWGLERESLNAKCREIWASGWRAMATRQRWSRPSRRKKQMRGWCPG